MSTKSVDLNIHGVKRVLAWDTERLTNVVDGQPNTFYTRRIRIEGKPGYSALELVLFADEPDALEIHPRP